MTELAERPEEKALTEQGRRVEHTDKEVSLALQLLAINGGNQKKTSDQLRQEGVVITRDTLRNWKDSAFPKRYAEIRREMSLEISEEVAGRAMERALQADEAASRYIAKAVEKIDEVDPNHLAKNAKALTDAKASEIEKARLLRNEPESITETRGVEELVAVLERTGVAKRVESESEVIEAEEIAT